MEFDFRAPEIYHSIVEKNSDKLGTIRDICQKTQRNNLRVLPSGYTVLSESAAVKKTGPPSYNQLKIPMELELICQVKRAYHILEPDDR